MSLPTRPALIGALSSSIAYPQLAWAKVGHNPASQKITDMKINLNFADHTLITTLYDNPSARDFYAMLPLDLTIDDDAHNEKIAYLPRKLTDEAGGLFDNE